MMAQLMPSKLSLHHKYLVDSSFDCITRHNAVVYDDHDGGVAKIVPKKAKELPPDAQYMWPVLKTWGIETVMARCLS